MCNLCCVGFFFFFILCSLLLFVTWVAPAAAPGPLLDNAFDVNAMKTEPLSCALKMSRCSSLSLSFSLSIQ